MNIAPDLYGKRVFLRKPKESDVEDRINIGRQAEFVRMCGGDTRNITPFTEEQASQWFEHVMTVQYEWVIEFEGKCEGIARSIINEKDKNTMYSIGIFDTQKMGKGLGTETTKIVLKYAFEKLSLHRVGLKVLEYNKRAIKCYEKCGFMKEGIERESALIEDKWENDVHMSILDYEYRQKYSGSD